MSTSIKGLSVKAQHTDIQVVDKSMAEVLACILLRDRELTKEERLLGWIMGECDTNGMAKIDSFKKEAICRLIGITMTTYHVYVHLWKDKGLIAKGTGKWLKFKTWTMVDTDKIVIHRTTNGMV